ncbi:uncharacterized protein [Salvelinus sp. IW2-2015]|uniref:uncharacterized protein n=1 Tax=Salvelinus sp. IW2-2015 TaxID=2691554 RepID=UPI0038D4D885
MLEGGDQGGAYLTKLCLSLSRPELLLQPQWGVAPWVWLLYRVFMLLYTLIWCMYSGLPFSNPKWLIFFSHLTYCLMVVYHLVVSCNLSCATLLVRCHFRERGNGAEPLGPFPLPFLLSISLRLQWFFHSLMCAFCLTMSFLYWSLDSPMEHHPLSPFNLNMHIGKSAQALLDLLLSAAPVHLAHHLYQLLISCLYILFAVAYWLADYTNLIGKPYIYKVLHIGGYPIVASLCVLGFALVCLPLCPFLVAVSLMDPSSSVFSPRRRGEVLGDEATQSLLSSTTSSMALVPQEQHGTQLSGGF